MRQSVRDDLIQIYDLMEGTLDVKLFNTYGDF